MTHHCTNIKKTNNAEHSTVTITAEIPADVLATFRAKAITSLAQEVSIDGFRKGHVPEDVLVKHVGEGTIFQEMANLALNEELPLLLAAEEVPGIAAPQVSVTKLAPGNPLGFTTTIDVLPEVNIKNYAATAKKVNGARPTISVADAEVNEVLTHLRRERAKIAKVEAGEKPEDAQKAVSDVPENELPALDDEFVKGFGYETVATFETKLRENMLADKTAKEKDAHRSALVDALIASTSFGVPHSLIDHEVHTMEAQFAEELSRNGSTLEQYLKHVDKTHDDLHREWHEPAEKRAKAQLILGEIAVKENLKADENELGKLVTQTKDHYKDVPEERIRAYYEHTLRNEAVLKWLEEQR
jgi:FKBP-type peptidyl-prolyl cis-trans isomerase (trigger factor)